MITVATLLQQKKKIVKKKKKKKHAKINNYAKSKLMWHYMRLVKECLLLLVINKDDMYFRERTEIKRLGSNHVSIRS